jgi:dolichyldiphosphatase
MPSTHSANMGYYATYICLASAYLPFHHSLPDSPLTRIVAYTIVPYSCLVVTSRIWLGHHNLEQVAAGCAWGFVVALGWFHLWTTCGLDRVGYDVEQLMLDYIGK